MITDRRNNRDQKDGNLDGSAPDTDPITGAPHSPHLTPAPIPTNTPIPTVTPIPPTPTPQPDPVGRYDADGDGDFTRTELRQVLKDYTDRKISYARMLELLRACKCLG